MLETSWTPSIDLFNSAVELFGFSHLCPTDSVFSKTLLPLSHLLLASFYSPVHLLPSPLGITLHLISLLQSLRHKTAFQNIYQSLFCLGSRPVSLTCPPHNHQYFLQLIFCHKVLFFSKTLSEKKTTDLMDSLNRSVEAVSIEWGSLQCCTFRSPNTVYDKSYILCIFLQKTILASLLIHYMYMIICSCGFMMLKKCKDVCFCWLL